MPRSSSGGRSSGRSSQSGSKSGNLSGKSERGLGSESERTRKEVSKKGGEAPRGGDRGSSSGRGGRSLED